MSTIIDIKVGNTFEDDVVSCIGVRDGLIFQDEDYLEKLRRLRDISFYMQSEQTLSETEQ